MTAITVTFPDEATLRAAVEAVGIVVGAQGGREDTPHYAAERVLDAALLHHEAGEELPQLAQLGDRADADKHGNRIAVEGCTRCRCGAKYWENDRCVSCGLPVQATDYTKRPCPACGAEAGEECRPMCIGYAAHLDALAGED